MDVSDQVHSLATMPSGKQLPAPTTLEAKDLVWTFRTTGKSLALQGIKPLFLSNPAYSLVSIMTPTVYVHPITAYRE